MSKGPWRRCPHTGLSLAKLERADGNFVVDGHFDTAILSDCDVFAISSIAALCGYLDVAYFRDVVRVTSACPIHVRQIALKDAASGRRIGLIHATHTNSALAGGETWRGMQKAAAQARANASRTWDASSGSNIRTR
jgi:hypothetical protein